MKPPGTLYNDSHDVTPIIIENCEVVRIRLVNIFFHFLADVIVYLVFLLNGEMTMTKSVY